MSFSRVQLVTFQFLLLLDKEQLIVFVLRLTVTCHLRKALTDKRLTINQLTQSNSNDSLDPPPAASTYRGQFWQRYNVLHKIAFTNSIDLV